MISDEQKDLAAQQQLGLDESWTIVYMATVFGFLPATEDVCDKLDADLEITYGDVTEAIDESLIDVELPKGWRLVGLRQKGGDGDSPRKYGLVDFSSLGAA